MISKVTLLCCHAHVGMQIHPVTDMNSVSLPTGTHVEGDIVDSPSIGHQACFPDVVSEEQQKAQGVHSVLTSWSSTDGELESSLCVYLLVFWVYTYALHKSWKVPGEARCKAPWSLVLSVVAKAGRVNLHLPFMHHVTLSKRQATACNTKGLQVCSIQFVMCCACDRLSHMLCLSSCMLQCCSTTFTQQFAHAKCHWL